MVNATALQRIGLIVLLAIGGPAAAGMYKWVDEQGNVQYSQQPPAGRQAESIKAPPPPSSSADEETARLKQQMEGFDERQGDRAKAAAEQQQSADVEAQRKANCEMARTNLQTLTSRGQISIKEGDEYRRLSEEERQAKIAEAQKQVDEFCK